MTGVFLRKTLSLEHVAEVSATVIAQDLDPAAIGVPVPAHRAGDLVVKTRPTTATTEFILAVVQRCIAPATSKYPVDLEVIVLSGKRHLRTFINNDALFFRGKGVEVVRTFHAIKTHEG